MKSIDVHHAQTHLSSLLERVVAGEEMSVTQGGKPVAKLVPCPAEPRKPGRLRGKIWMSEDFDAPLPISMDEDQPTISLTAPGLSESSAASTLGTKG